MAAPQGKPGDCDTAAQQHCAAALQARCALALWWGFDPEVKTLGMHRTCGAPGKSHFVLTRPHVC
jgi:hypothetical protein